MAEHQEIRLIINYLRHNWEIMGEIVHKHILSWDTSEIVDMYFN